MKITPAIAAAWAKPITTAYEKATDMLLVNIASHFEIEDTLSGATEWQFRKMAELGQLTRENVEIIARLTGDTSQQMKAIINKAAADALRDVEPKLKAAAALGYLTGAPEVSPRVAELVDTLAAQAAEKANLVNQSILQSAAQSYLKIVANVPVYESAAMTAAQAAAAQQTMNAAAFETATGITSRSSAVRAALRQLSDEGLTGFVDSAGRKWQADSYINMVVRTTATNTAHKAVFERNAEYGNDYIAISSHGGARPLCAPYQGKVYSLSNRAGVIKDASGGRVRFYPWNSTSYGEAAGLLGINCGHFAYPFIPNLSNQNYEPTENEEENERAYNESQQQRQLERNVRYAKRDYNIARAAGDEELITAYRARKTEALSKYNSFIERTDRKEKLDRIGVAKK